MSRLKDLSRMGEYMITTKLGEGGFGLVMKAQSLRSGEQVPYSCLLPGVPYSCLLPALCARDIIAR